MRALPFHESIPLYHQIAQMLRLRVSASAADGLATEQKLCAEFGVSRTTIRQALAALKQEGLLESKRGVGTRIIRPRVVTTLTRSNGDPLHAGLGSDPRLVLFGLAKPPAAAAEFLEMPLEDPALRILRTHQLDREPLSVVQSWLPAEVSGRITPSALRGTTLHDLLYHRYGLLQRKSTHTIRVARADAQIASLLGITLADPVLYIQSSVRLDDGRPIRWTENWFREDRYQYSAEMLWKKPTGKKK
jgi:DNA-binding GntR family transcriptional regulator